MVRDLGAALTTVGGILGWWLVIFLLSGCAVLLPLGLGIQAAISVGSEVVSVKKWWEDRTFQQAQIEEIRKLREAVEAHQAEVRLLRQGVPVVEPPPFPVP